jgi:hypothetical protein
LGGGVVGWWWGGHFITSHDGTWRNLTVFSNPSDSLGSRTRSPNGWKGWCRVSVSISCCSCVFYFDCSFSVDSKGNSDDSILFNHVDLRTSCLRIVVHRIVVHRIVVHRIAVHCIFVQSDFLLFLAD